VIQVLGWEKLWLEALKTYSDLIAYGLLPDLYTFSTLITACGKSGRWEEALKVFGAMKDYNITPDTVTYNALISACGNGGQ
jgi:pentatricopeptide repeat domain-containing protein 1